MEYNPKDKKRCVNEKCDNPVEGREDKKYCSTMCRDRQNKTDQRRREKKKPLADIIPPTFAIGLDVCDGVILSGRNVKVVDTENTSPERYTKGDIECIDAIKSAVTGKRPEEAVMVGNVIKYLWRYESKNGLDDIEKAIAYLGFLKKEYINHKNK